MNAILIPILLLILIGVVAAMGFFIVKELKRKETPPPPWEPPLQARIEHTQMMGNDLREFSEQMRERLGRERDAELAAYAQNKKFHQPINNPLPTMEGDDRVHQTNPKAEKILIPEGLTEEERAITKEFFNL